MGDDCEKRSKKMLAQMLNDQTEKIKDTVMTNFKDRTDAILNDIEQYRIPTGDRLDSQTAKGIIENSYIEKKNMESRLMNVLSKDARKRWLGGHPDVHAVWSKVDWD